MATQDRALCEYDILHWDECTNQLNRVSGTSEEQMVPVPDRLMGIDHIVVTRYTTTKTNHSDVSETRRVVDTSCPA